VTTETKHLEPGSHDLIVRGVRVRYTELGAKSSPLLLLIHGYLVSGRCWSLVAPKLAEHFRVVMPDLPGFGESEKPIDYNYTREGFAETILDLLAGLDAPRAHICGHSMGGAIALTLAADHAERVNKLAVINSVSYPFKLPLAGRLAAIPGLGEFMIKRLYKKAVLRDYFKKSVYAPGFKMDEEMFSYFYSCFDRPESRESAFRSFAASTDLSSLTPKVTRVKAPTMILWGEMDPMFPVSLAQRLSRDIIGSQLHTLPGCGHAPPEEQPEKTAALLLEHFQS
jgi:pimeloyl-ACP methyl ester carboxylesterase